MTFNVHKIMYTNLHTKKNLYRGRGTPHTLPPLGDFTPGSLPPPPSLKYPGYTIMVTDNGN